MNIPENLKYTSSHEWIADNGDGTVTVGITAVATEQLGDLVYVELPKAGSKVARGGTCAVVESTKAASDVYAPVTGEKRIRGMRAPLSGCIVRKRSGRARGLPRL